MVTTLGKAAQTNRTYDTLALAGAVNAGALNALQAAFSGKQPNVLKKYQTELLKEVIKSRPKERKISGDANALFAGFGGSTQQVNGGRRKDKSSSPDG